MQSREARSELLEAVREAVSDLHDAGVMDEPTARRLEGLCLNPAEALDRLSQGVMLDGVSLRALIGRDDH